MKFLRLAFVGWLAGLLAYVGALALLHGERISAGDLGAVAFYSLIAFAFCFFLVYLPILSGLRRVVHARSGLLFSLVAILLGIVPTAMIARFLGGSLRALITPEAVLFYILFSVVGLVIGVGFARLQIHE